MSDSSAQSEASLEQIDRQITQNVENIVDRLRKEIGDRIRQTSEELAGQIEALSADLPETFVSTQDVKSLVGTAAPAAPATGGGDASALLEAVGRVDATQGQAEILMSLVQEARQFADRSAFFLVRGQEVRGWASLGFGEIDPVFSQKALAADELFSGLAAGGPAQGLDAQQCASIAAQLGAPAGSAAVLVPFVLRGQISGALYADRLSGNPDAASLQLLTYVASLALDTSGANLRTSASPSLPPVSLASSDSSDAPAEDSESEPEPAAAAPEPAPEPPAPEPPAPEPVAAEPEPEPEPVAAEPVVPEPQQPADSMATVRLDVSQIQSMAQQSAPEPTPDPEPAPEPQYELEPVESASTQVTPPSTQVTPPSTQVTPPSTQVTPPSTQVQPPSTQVTPPGGPSEVSPPGDLQGPGSAFAAPSAAGGAGSGIPAGEEALHEEARRLARLLVSEIKLYNEEVIEEGRKAGNIYARLKEDIDRSRQMYEERIDSRLQDKDDYFHQELVQRLAGGDPTLLGM